jgi:hypothetical protein
MSRRIPLVTAFALAASGGAGCFSSSSPLAASDAGDMDVTVDTGTPDTGVADASLDATSALDARADTGTTPVDSAAPFDAAVAEPEAGPADAGADAPLDGSTVVSLTNPIWAQWPVPNSPVDVEAGAPHPQSYTNNGDGTTTDNVTGLMWQQTPIIDGGSFPEVYLPDAVSYCAGLSLAGHADWRIPTVVELESILDYNVAYPGPAFNATYFPGAPGNPFWSTTPVPNSQQAWFLESNYAVVSASIGSDQELGETYSFYCVRGGVGPFAPPAAPSNSPSGRYASADAGVQDTKTGLVWQPAASTSEMTYASARTYCAGPWRLPTVSELFSIVDFTDVPNSITPVSLIDSTFFPNTPAGTFWASTPGAGQTGYAWALDFTTELVNHSFANAFPDSNTFYVRCVQ